RAAHPAAAAAFVTVTDPRCLHDARRQHHYSTLLIAVKSGHLYIGAARRKYYEMSYGLNIEMHKQ
ncbi:hypothetical protein JOQ06_005932, partial [Pogonophryne albipinna]